MRTMADRVALPRCALALRRVPRPPRRPTRRLVDAVRAAQEGQGDSARAAVQRLLDATPPTDTLYPQILYTQAMVAGTAGDMRRQLQRVTVEYGTSSWADDALLRLVQMDYATRNFDGAARNLERLRLDFPATPLLPQAAYWAGRTYFDANNPAAACRWLADGMAQAQNDVELQNQLGYLYQRCDLRADSGAAGRRRPTARAPRDHRACSGSAPTPPTAAGTRGSAPGRRRERRPPPPPPAPTARRPARTVYRVQIAAVATRKAAEDAARKARPLGLTVVTRRGEGSLQGAGGRVPDARGRAERRGQPQGQARRQSVRRLGALTGGHARRARCAALGCCRRAACRRRLRAPADCAARGRPAPLPPPPACIAADSAAPRARHGRVRRSPTDAGALGSPRRSSRRCGSTARAGRRAGAGNAWSRGHVGRFWTLELAAAARRGARAGAGPPPRSPRPGEPTRTPAPRSDAAGVQSLLPLDDRRLVVGNSPHPSRAADRVRRPRARRRPGAARSEAW